MNNISLTAGIMQVVCGLACAGLGIYYFVTAQTTQEVVFTVVGAVCFVWGIRTFLKLLKSKKDGDDKDKKE